MSQGFAKEQVEQFALADTPAVDAFGRLRVSQPDYRFDGQLVYQVSPDIWDTAFPPSLGTVTYDRTNKFAACTVYATGSAVLQSHYHAPYTPGRSQSAFMSFIMGTTPGGGATRRVGYWDGTNGVFLEQTSSGVNLVEASSTSYLSGTNAIPQGSWNIDTMQGTGPSGYTLDLTKTQILHVSLQALYSGRVLVGLDIGGDIRPIHQFNHANIAAFPYIGQASLPIRYEVRGNGTGITMNPICASVISEGGAEIRNVPARTFTASNGGTSIGVTTRRPILSIRPLKFFNQSLNHGLILPSAIGANASGQSGFLEIVRNGTLTGASWSSVDSANSMAESDISATTISGGTVIFSTYVNNTAGITSTLSENLLGRLVASYSHLMDQADVISIVATSMTGTANLSAALTWKEIR